jgi:hypothetical protein
MDVPRVDYEKLASDRTGEASEVVPAILNLIDVNCWRRQN